MNIKGLSNLSIVSILFSTLTYAEGSIQFIPLTRTKVKLSHHSSALIQYHVINSTDVARTFSMVAIPGVTQVTNKKNFCPNLFTLTPQQSCLLILQLNGNQLPKRVNRGPILCESKNKLDLSSCSQPTLSNKLNITKINSSKAGLNLNACTLVLTAGGSSGSVGITNQSKIVTAKNIYAALPTSWSDVSQDASSCTSVPPGGFCQIFFTPGNTVHDPVTVPIQGTNTSKSFLTISVQAPSVTSLSVTGSPLTLGVNSSGTLAITNNSSATATNINANFIGTALQGVVSQTASTCSSVKSGSTCALTFTSNGTTTSLPLTSFPVKGTNTITIYPEIAIAIAPGNSYQGGTVGCVGGGLNNLIAVIADNSAGIIWGDYMFPTSATSTTDGLSNTINIVTTESSLGYPSGSYAASLCQNYTIDSQGNSPCVTGTCYNNWFLPAEDQLNCLYTNKAAIGSFSTNNYWSSTQIGTAPVTAWAVNFLTGNQPPNMEANQTYNVRCVHTF